MAPTEGRLIPEKARNFKTPLYYFMSIFPLAYWKIIAEQTNKYAEWWMEQQFLNNDKRTLSGAKSSCDTTYQEIVKFYAVLIFMWLFLLTGANYTTYWEYGSPMFLWTTTTQIRIFKQLCSVLHFNSNEVEFPGKEALHKTHSLINILKKTMGAFTIPGSELALNQASAASRSNFGRHIIFYNPAKNCDKFHFRFYIPYVTSTFLHWYLRWPQKR
jgi:hypothetical protein